MFRTLVAECLFWMVVGESPIKSQKEASKRATKASTA